MSDVMLRRCFCFLAMLIALSFLDSFDPMLTQPLQAAPWPAASRAAAGVHPQPLASASLACKASDARSEQRLPPWAAAGRTAAAAAAAQRRHARRGLGAVAAASSQQGSIEDTIAVVLELQLDVLPGSPQFEANVRYLSRLAGKWGRREQGASEDCLFPASLPHTLHIALFPIWQSTTRACVQLPAGWLHSEQGVSQGLAIKLAMHIPLELSRNPLDSLEPNFRLFR